MPSPNTDDGSSPASVPDFDPVAAFQKRTAVRRDEVMRGGPDDMMGRVLELELAVKRLRSMGGPSTGGGTVTLEHPFKIQMVDADTVNVRFGTVNDFTPTNIATDIDVSGSATYTFYLDVEIDIDGNVIAVTLSNGTSGKPPDEDYHGYKLVGEVIVVGGAITTINQNITHSLEVAMCGRVVSDGPTLDKAGTYQFWGF